MTQDLQLHIFWIAVIPANRVFDPGMILAQDLTHQIVFFKKLGMIQGSTPATQDLTQKHDLTVKHMI